MAAILGNLLALFIMPTLLSGLIVRVKSLWSGRLGPPLLQPAYDGLRLLRKSPVYSATTTSLFRVAPWVYLATSVASAAVTPLVGDVPLIRFPFDFVWLMYTWALGRMALMLAALDTGSSFEGLGASREATFSSLLEPALFLALAALCLNSGSHSLWEVLAPRLHTDGLDLAIRACAVATLFIALQVEAARMPVDDPATHLELTMLHEAMVLDHSGADLAAVQLGSQVKLFVCSALLAALINPFGGKLAAVAQLGVYALIAVVVGSIESLTARLRLRSIPRYIACALTSAVVALLATAWRS